MFQSSVNPIQSLEQSMIDSIADKVAQKLKGSKFN